MAWGARASARRLRFAAPLGSVTLRTSAARSNVVIANSRPVLRCPPVQGDLDRESSPFEKYGRGLAVERASDRDRYYLTPS